MVRKSAKKDILIPVMGATGAGKSSFINSLLGQEKMKVGRHLELCTTELAFGYIEALERYPLLKDYRIVLIDTPGFDDTHKTDLEILVIFATWLKDCYKRGAILGGVIYLHDITAARFTDTASRNLQMFRSLLGEDVLDNLVLGTTKWGLHVPNSDLRHDQLVTDYWKPLLDDGAEAFRIEDTASAWKLIERIISPRTKQSERRDMLILVMGATGAGKSTFINSLLGQEKMIVGAGLKSCTTEPNVATMDGHPPPENYRLTLIDTPGFDDTIDTDLAILTKIATWLKNSYKEGAKLGGVIYLHDITAPRFDGPAARHLEIFRKLCGNEALDHVVLGTTKWGLNIPGSEETHRELETKYWKSLIEKGAHVRRFDGTHKSAQSLVNAIISTPIDQPLNQTVLQIESAISGPTSYTIAGTETSYTKQFMKTALQPFVGLFRKHRAPF